MVVDHKITNVRALIPLLSEAHAAHKPLLIISADGLESEVLNTLILNRFSNGIKVVAVKAPGFGDNRNANLQDIATLTGQFNLQIPFSCLTLIGAEVVSADLGLKLEDVKVKNLGTAKSITVDANSTLITGGGGSAEVPSCFIGKFLTF